MFPTGGHNGCDADRIDTIFKGDHTRNMVTKFDSKSTIDGRTNGRRTPL
jgi:hypothetical protein